MKKEIDKFVNEFIIPNAKKIVEEKEQEHIPIFFIKGKKIGVVGAMFSNQEEKVACREFVRKQCIKDDADFLVFVSEGWQIERKEIDPDERPSKAKDRQEVLQIMVNERSGKLVGYMCKIKRKRNKRMVGKPLKLEGHAGSLFRIEW